MKIPLSVLIMTKNEELNIEGCLENLSWADDIVVVDSFSEDRTLDIVRKYTKNIYHYKWDGKWPKKSWSFEVPRFKYDWILMIDADERVTEEFLDEVKSVVLNEDNNYSGYLIRYLYWFMGRYIRYGDPVRKLVLFRRSKTSFERFDISSSCVIQELEVGHEHPIVDGKVGFFKSYLLHHDTRPLYYFFERHNKYSSWEAELMYRKHSAGFKDLHIKADRSGNIMQFRRYLKNLFLRLPFKPILYFIYSYFFRLGFLDGYPGLCYNICKSIYAYQIGIKTYELKIKSSSKSVYGQPKRQD